MKRVVISGFYGFHNIGDEAILMTLTNQLRKMNPDVQITVLSHNPPETEEKFGVKAIDRRNAFQVFSAILKTDVLLSGGGSLLQDDTSARSIHYYLAVLKMGVWLGKKVFLVSNGIGPLIRPQNRRRVARLLNHIQYSTVRDAGSYKLLMDIGVKPEKVSVSADLVIGMDCESPEEGRAILEKLNFAESDRKKVAVAIRQKDFRTEERREKLVRLANTLAEHHTVVFVPFYYKNDTKIYEDIHDRVNQNVYFITDKYHSKTFMSLIENFDLLIGSRLHSLIFALVAEVPFLGISYDPKIDHFLESIGKKAICSMAGFDDQALIRAVQRVFDAYDSEKKSVVAAKAHLLNQLKENERMLKAFL